MAKKNLLILFGGQSSEHEVSCRSAATVIRAADPEKYELILVGITKDGKWVKAENLSAVEEDTWRDGVPALLSPDAVRRGVWFLEKDGAVFQPVDVAFPVLHGLCGEDGTIQGLFEMARIPYVGCGVLASALSMDKVYTKKIVADLGIRQASCVSFRREELAEMDLAAAQVETVLSYPVFVKPSRAGSSCGVGHAHNREELIKDLREAARHDRIVMVEETIKGREVECAVLGGTDPAATGLGEILPTGDFYDYDLKYNSDECQTALHPDLSEKTVKEIRGDALKIFRAVDGWGMARVDFFVESRSGQVVFNEINTIPGFTSISMSPQLREAEGLSTAALVDELIRLAFERR